MPIKSQSLPANGLDSSSWLKLHYNTSHKSSPSRKVYRKVYSQSVTLALSLGIKWEIFVQIILLQMKCLNDSTKNKFRSAEKFKKCTTFKSKSIDWISKFADSGQNKILCHTRALDSVFHNIQLHIFFSHKILGTYFLHKAKSFVLKSWILYVKFFTCQRH